MGWSIETWGSPAELRKSQVLMAARETPNLVGRVRDPGDLMGHRVKEGTVMPYKDRESLLTYLAKKKLGITNECKKPGKFLVVHVGDVVGLIACISLT